MEKSSTVTFTRSALAKATGVGLETLRFYEQKEVLREPQRNASGYRIYGESDLERLLFVQRSQGLGFSLAEIKQLLAMTEDIDAPRAEVRKFADEKLSSIREKIQVLKAMERALSGLVDQCSGSGKIKGCPIAEFIGGKKSRTIKKCHE